MNLSTNFHMSSVVLSIFIMEFCIAVPTLKTKPDTTKLQEMLENKKLKHRNEIINAEHPFCHRETDILSLMCNTANKLLFNEDKISKLNYTTTAQMTAEKCENIKLIIQKSEYEVLASGCRKTFVENGELLFHLIESETSNSFYVAYTPLKKGHRNFVVWAKIENYLLSQPEGKTDGESPSQD